VKSIKALEAIAPAWRALDEQTFPRLPFTRPRWNLLWCDTSLNRATWWPIGFTVSFCSMATSFLR